MISRLSIGICLAACGTTPSFDVDQQSLIGGCNDEDFCGHNSPQIAHYGMYNFNLDGLPNNAGFRIFGLSQDRTFYNLVVQDSRIIGVDDNNKPLLQGSDLIGAKIWVDHKGVQAGIVISNVGLTAEVVSPYLELETYELDWSAVIGNPLPRLMHFGDTVSEMPHLDSTVPPMAVCPEPPDGSHSEWDESAGMSPVASLVFEGDVIHSDTRTIDAKYDDRWFNVGCAAHTLTKMRLTRNTIHTAGAWEPAQAALKMLSADYCGHGMAFTVSGEPLVWQDRGAMSYWQTPRGLEARWSEEGALCLDEPRLANTQLASPFKDLLQDIEDECNRQGRSFPPQCKSSDYDFDKNLPNELITSGNYD